MHLAVSLLFISALTQLFSSNAQAAKRVALVIGNSSYSVFPFKNPKNNALDISKALKRSGPAIAWVANRSRINPAARECGLGFRLVYSGQ